MSINDIFVGQHVCKQAHTHAKLSGFADMQL